MGSSARTIASVLLLWAVFWVGLSSSYQNLDSDLIETETGWQFDDDINVFGNSTNSTTTTTTTKSSSSTVALTNGDFESTNVTTNQTTLADQNSTAIINWTPGGAGVQIIQSSTYQMSSTNKSGVFAIHLNNPASTGNGTQGMITTTLSTTPTSGKQYTVQYDTARMPDGPINLWPALKVSFMTANTTQSFQLHRPTYNSTDTQKQITWTRQSFVYTGSGASTQIRFESMSEKYGPLIDNVVILVGNHPLSAASLSKLAMWHRMCPIFTVIVLMGFLFPTGLSNL